MCTKFHFPLYVLQKFLKKKNLPQYYSELLLLMLLNLRNLIAYGKLECFVKLIETREPEMFSYTFRILMRGVSFIGDDHHGKTIVSHNIHN